MDRVKVNSLTDFASPQEVGNKVIAVEKAKDGVFYSKLLSADLSRASMNADFPSYDIEYEVESSRGSNHYSVKTSIIEKRLFVFTVQSAEKDAEALKNDVRYILDSIHVER